MRSLNPYSNGMLTQSDSPERRTPYGCLNPYSNGMLTQKSNEGGSGDGENMS